MSSIVKNYGYENDEFIQAIKYLQRHKIKKIRGRILNFQKLVVEVNNLKNGKEASEDTEETSRIHWVR